MCMHEYMNERVKFHRTYICSSHRFTYICTAQASTYIWYTHYFVSYRTIHTPCVRQHSLSFACQNPHCFHRLHHCGSVVAAAVAVLFYVLISVLILFQKSPTSVQFFLILALQLLNIVFSRFGYFILQYFSVIL